MKLVALACKADLLNGAAVGVGDAEVASGEKAKDAMLDAGYTSHVTRHTSHVTRHTSHATRHTSHVTRHTLHVTRHTSHVTRHTSHVTRHTSHVTRHTSHVTRYSSHVTRHTLHVITSSRHTPHLTHQQHLFTSSIHQSSPVYPVAATVVIAPHSLRVSSALYALNSSLFNFFDYELQSFFSIRFCNRCRRN